MGRVRCGPLFVLFGFDSMDKLSIVDYNGNSWGKFDNFLGKAEGQPQCMGHWGLAFFKVQMPVPKQIILGINIDSEDQDRLVGFASAYSIPCFKSYIEGASFTYRFKKVN